MEFSCVKYMFPLSVIFYLSGCNIIPPSPGDPAYAPVAPERMIPPPNESGAIYQAGYETRLFDDRKAHRVGDILTILLVETTSAKKQADTKTTKNDTIAMDSPIVLGKTATYNDKYNLSASTTANRSFDGKGQSDQSNNLNGTITVSVSEILPNGNLKIRGEKWMTINRGDEYIRLTGIVRPDDISPDNQVESTKVADARMEYSGTGEVANSNVAGWLGKFFSSMLWPF